MTASIVLVGAGPRALGILLRLGANAPEFADGREVHVHVVDPHPAGGGRIWRRQQSPLLWMNSLTRDVTVFTDDSVECEGPIDGGPSLAEWIAGPGQEQLRRRGWLDDAAAGQPVSLGPDDFAPRAVLAEYLDWVWERAIAALPPQFSVSVHATHATGVADLDGGRQRVALADGTTVFGDVVVLAQGYLDQYPAVAERTREVAAQARDLVYVPTGHTADLDLQDLPPGADVIVRGMGLAFVDLFVLLGQGRGGRFTGEAGELTYHPSGREPILHVGSGRGVPYHAKLGYDIGATGPVPLRHLTERNFAGQHLLDWDRDVWPVVVRELADLHYRRLFSAHPERTVGQWQTLERAIADEDLDGPVVRRAVERQVPDVADRFDIDLIDQPLRRRSRGSRSSVEADVAAHIENDLRRRRDPEFSSDRAVFDGLLSVYGFLATLASAGRLTSHDRVVKFERTFHGLFSFLASGPPPRRLAELLALHRAGVVRFLGPDLQVELDGNSFLARSRAHPGVVRARALVEARLPAVDITLVSDPLIRSLVRADELRVETVHDPHTGSPIGGKLAGDKDTRAVRADGSVHPRRFLVGPAVTGSIGSGGFVRPGHNGPGLRQNDAIARNILALLKQSGAGSAGSAEASSSDTPQGSDSHEAADAHEHDHHHARNTVKEHSHAS